MSKTSIIVVVLLIVAGVVALLVYRHGEVAKMQAAQQAQASSTPASDETADTAQPSDTGAPTRLRLTRPRASNDVEPVANDAGLQSVASALPRLRQRFKACYNKGLKLTPDLEGKIEVQLVVAPTGEVTSATKTSGGVSQEVDDCILTNAKHARFEASPSGTTVTVPLTFSRPHT